MQDNIMEIDKAYKSQKNIYFILAKIEDHLVYGQFKLEETPQNKHMGNYRVSTIETKYSNSFDFEPAKNCYVKELNELKRIALKKLFMGWLLRF